MTNDIGQNDTTRIVYSFFLYSCQPVMIG